MSPKLCITNLSQDEQSSSKNHTDLSQGIWSKLIDRCNDYPSDPYLFIDAVLSPQLIRILVEIGPCQPGYDNVYTFQENESGKCFLPSWYKKETKSGLICKRNWLVYSPKSYKMYCFYCFLFRSISQHSYQWSDPKKGVSNFRKGNEKIIKHEKSKEHRIAENEYFLLKNRIFKDNTIQQNMIKIQKSQIEHNRNVLKRLINLSLFLSTNGLPFRGHRENINDETPNKGLFLELVNLVSKYDAVLAKHLADSNRNETYLSHSIQNDILSSMAHETSQIILNEVKLAKYFTIIVDSTIDVGRIDQFSFSLRFVDQEGNIKEHFLCFEELPSASADDYLIIIKKLMKKYELDISLCRGQAYDGANTMSGRFSGLQSKIKELSPLALYIHCCAHNLNLVLIDSIRSSLDAVTFFGTLETLYSFITSSLPRLKLFQKEQELINGLILTLKKLSETRWASHKRAIDSVYINLPAIVNALQKIADGKILNTKLKIISEAQGLIFQIKNFKFSFLLVLWKNILEKVYILSNYLQNSKIDLITAHSMIEVCYSDILLLRTDEHFINIKQRAIKLCEQFGGAVEFEEKRVKTKKRIHGEKNTLDVIKSADQNFKFNTYFVILDSFTNTLKNRFEDYSSIVKKFEVLDPKKFIKGNIDEFKISVAELANFYKIDIDETDIVPEYKSFCLVYNQIYSEKESLQITEVLKFMISQDMVSSYPNLYVLYKIFYTLPVSSATAERSFSRLKLLKTYLRSTMCEERLSHLAILSIERNIAENIDFNRVIDTFSLMKNRRKLL